MMKTLYIGIKDILSTVKDFKALALIVAMPLVLVIILGLAFGSYFKSGLQEPIKIAFVTHDTGEISKQFQEKVLNHSDVKKLFESSSATEDMARTLLKSKEIDAVIIFPQDLSLKFSEGALSEITILKSAADDIRGIMTEQLVKGFVSQWVRTGAGIAVLMEKLSESGANEEEIQASMNKLTEQLQFQVDFKEQTEENRMVNSFQYYSVGMLAMFLLFTLQLGTKSILSEREDNTFTRLIASNVRKSSIVAGKSLGIFFIALLQIAVMIGFTRLVFGVDWGDSLSGLLLLSVCSSIAISGFSILIASIAKTAGTAQAISSILMFSMSAIGGSFTPLYNFEGIMKTLSNLSINKWIIQGHLSLMNHGNIMTIHTELIGLTSIGILALFAGTLRLKLVRE